MAVAEDERYGLKYSKKKAKPQQSLTISPLLKQQTNDTFENTTTNVNDDKELGNTIITNPSNKILPIILYFRNFLHENEDNDGTESITHYSISINS